MDVSKNSKANEADGPFDPSGDSLEALHQGAESAAHGTGLLDEVASLTGLPSEWVQGELTKIVTNSGHTPQNLTLDELRASMLAYLEEMQKDIEAMEQEEAHALESAPAHSDLSH